MSTDIQDNKRIAKNSLFMSLRIILVGVDEENKKKIPSDIITISRTSSQAELAVLYSLAEIVLNLSYEETFGMTTVEGFACGTPSIGYNKTATPELITPQTGIIINETGNIRSIIEAIESISNNGKEYYTSACRARAVALYNKDDRFNEYIELYKTFIHKD